MDEVLFNMRDSQRQPPAHTPTEPESGNPIPRLYDDFSNTFDWRYWVHLYAGTFVNGHLILKGELPTPIEIRKPLEENPTIDQQHLCIQPIGLKTFPMADHHIYEVCKEAHFAARGTRYHLQNQARAD